MRIISILASVAALVVLTPRLGRSADPRSEAVIIGCLERTGAGAYRVNDHRSQRAYQVHGDNSTPMKTLDWQVGHQLEIHGTLQAQPGSGPLRLDVSSVIEISPRCLPVAQKDKG